MDKKIKLTIKLSSESVFDKTFTKEWTNAGISKTSIAFTSRKPNNGI